MNASFNSATAVTPWMTSLSTWQKTPRGPLQFGHGGDAVDDSTYTRWRSVKRVCFNSATAVTPWIPGCSTTWNAGREELQFGHGGDAVDDVRIDVTTGD